MASEFELERALAALHDSSGTAMIDERQQLEALRQLQRRIGTADAASLSQLRQDIAATLSAAQAVTTRATAITSDDTLGQAAELAHLANAGRAQVAGIWRDLHAFGPLRFASTDDEEAYRRREAERRAYADAELAKGTPQGDLNASGATIGQMADAAAHGAHGPAFEQRWTELVATTAKLRDAVRRSGGSTQEFDDRLRADLRRIMKAKGLSDAEIDAQFAAHPDPLDAAKAYVQGDADMRDLRSSALHASATHQNQSVSADAPREAVDDPLARLQAAGVTMSAVDSPIDKPSHGVAASYAARPTERAI